GERSLEPRTVASGQIALHEVGRHASTIPQPTGSHQPHETVDLLLRRCGHACDELRSGADAELAVHLREVPHDSIRAQAELVGDLAVPAARDDQLDDPAFGLGELAVGGGPPADPAKLRARLVCPRTRTQPLENDEGTLEGLAGGALVLRLPPHASE